MKLNAVSDEMVLIIEEIQKDIPKALKGNKTAAQRVRTKTIAFTKISKTWRKLSLLDVKE